MTRDNGIVMIKAMDAYLDVDKDETPFQIQRVYLPNRSVLYAPSVVSCTWTKITVENLYSKSITKQELSEGRACTRHRGCKGHLRTNEDGSTYMIPSGFATGDELVESDSHMINRMVMDGRRNSDDMRDFCFSKISGKNGILRKMCNGTRPTNTCRFVVSPSKGPMDTVYLPTQVFDKGMFLYAQEDGRCVVTKLEERSVVIVGRCPSQGSDSALPMLAMRSVPGESSMRVPLEICSKNNGDFDGDEMWVFVPMSRAGYLEAHLALQRVWCPSENLNVLGTMEAITNVDNNKLDVDPMMYTTMTFEEMVTHQGGEAYTVAMLKPKVWRQMTLCMFSSSYWKSWVKRSEQGIVNTIVGRHGIAGPYGIMRLGMMLGTCMSTNGVEFTIDSQYAPSVPSVLIVPGTNRSTCSSAMAKMTKIMYQRGIDISKHGSVTSLVPAIEALMTGSLDTYTISMTSRGLTTVATKLSMGYEDGSLHTNLKSLSSSGMGSTLFQSALMLTCMVEEIDRVRLTNQERCAFALLMCFLCTNVESVMATDTVKLMYSLGLDWYTSVTCSDVRWIKQVLRNRDKYPNARMDSDVNSTLGSFFLGNMSVIVSTNESRTKDSDMIGGDSLFTHYYEY